MTEIDNDKLLKDFFAENKREIADNGFSRRVMHQLPRSQQSTGTSLDAICNDSRSSALHHSGRTASCMGNTEGSTDRHDQPRCSQPRSEINHHCNGRPAFHGRTESSIAGITSIAVPCANGLSQLCHCIGTAVPSRWHNCDSPLAQP